MSEEKKKDDKTQHEFHENLSMPGARKVDLPEDVQVPEGSVLHRYLTNPEYRANVQAQAKAVQDVFRFEKGERIEWNRKTTALMTNQGSTNPLGHAVEFQLRDAGEAVLDNRLGVTADPLRVGWHWVVGAKTIGPFDSEEDALVAGGVITQRKLTPDKLYGRQRLLGVWLIVKYAWRVLWTGEK